MYAPLPPHYRTPEHTVHLAVTILTAGLWGIVWHWRCRVARLHNEREDLRFRVQADQAAAVNAAERVAHREWMHGQVGWLASEVRRCGNPPPAVRPPFVVDAHGVPPRAPQQATGATPVSSTPRPQRAPLPSPRPSPVPRTQGGAGRHSMEDMGTSIVRRVEPKQP